VDWSLGLTPLSDALPLKLSSFLGRNSGVEGLEDNHPVFGSLRNYTEGSAAARLEIKIQDSSCRYFMCF
jgi:hypothetical protein